METLGPPVPQTSRLELRPLTGRTHQLRVHCLAMGHPIVGDSLYGPGAAALTPAAAAARGGRAASAPKDPDGLSAPAAGVPCVARLLLHASFIAFTHPATGKPIEISAPCPF